MTVIFLFLLWNSFSLYFIGCQFMDNKSIYIPDWYKNSFGFKRGLITPILMSLYPVIILDKTFKEWLD